MACECSLKIGYQFERVVDLPIVPLILDMSIGAHDHMYLSGGDCARLNQLKIDGGMALIWLRTSNTMKSLKGWKGRQNVFGNSKMRDLVCQSMERYQVRLNEAKEVAVDFPENSDLEQSGASFRVTGNVLAGCILVDLSKAGNYCGCWDELTSTSFGRRGKCVPVLKRLMLDTYCDHTGRWSSITLRKVERDYFLFLVRNECITADDTKLKMKQILHLLA